MKNQKPLTRNECLHALIGLDDSNGMARDIYRFITDKYFWNKDRKFTLARLIDLLHRLHKQGRWQSDNEKNILNEYLNKLYNSNI